MEDLQCLWKNKHNSLSNSPKQTVTHCLGMIRYSFTIFLSERKQLKKNYKQLGLIIVQFYICKDKCANFLLFLTSHFWYILRC